MLDERDEVPLDEISAIQLLDNTSVRAPQSQLDALDWNSRGDEGMNEASTWLEDDDIDED